MEWRADPVTELFDPLHGPTGGWPGDQRAIRAYLEAFARAGSTALIANLRTQVMGLESEGRILPVTVNEAEYGDSYVCLPHTAYALYAKDELRLVDAGPWTPALRQLASLAGSLLRAAQANRIVNVDNWMLSTNLHDSWDGDGLDSIQSLLSTRFPQHMLAVRSVSDWSDAALMQRLRSNGWLMLPSRQVWVTDDLAADWAPHRDTRRDLDLLAATPYSIDPLDALRPGDAQRIAELYRMLYVDRYSALNPVFTDAYVEMTHREKILEYRGLRDAEGRLSAVAGFLIRGGVLTTPIVGYDTARPASEGLYRMTSALFAQVALERGLRLHGSAGAASFKRNRGARPAIEYTAFYVGHLSRFRRSVMASLAHALERIAVPLLSERGL